MGLRILIFDDDLWERRQSWAQEFPALELHFEKTADEAERLVARLEPDVVLMDFHFRGSAYRGSVAVLGLRRRFGEELEIIGISSADASNVLLLQAGADRCIPKGEVPRLLADL